jgi:hypothetical protein
MGAYIDMRAPRYHAMGGLVTLVSSDQSYPIATPPIPDMV